MTAPVQTQAKSAPKVAASTSQGNLLQRQHASAQPASLTFSPHLSEAPPTVQSVLRSPGQPLDSATRAFMEPRFRHDFSRVRVHSSAIAEQSARDMNAQAYTVGNDIVFGTGRFAPQTSEGMRLLAHELTHVVQQASGLEARRLQARPNDKKPAAGVRTFPFNIIIAGEMNAAELLHEFVKQYYSYTTEAQIQSKLPLWQIKRGTSPEEVAKGVAVVIVTTANETDPESLDPKEKEALNAETDKRFWASTGYKPGQKLGASAKDKEMGQVWLGVRRAVMTEDKQRKEIEALPEDIKKVLFAGGTGAAAVSPDDYTQLLRIAHKLAGLSPEKRQDYLSRVTASTASYNDLEAAIDSYLKFQAQREQESQIHETTAKPLLGAEDLYTLYKSYKSLKANSSLAHATKGAARDKGEAQEATELLDDQLQKTETDLLAMLKLKGFASIAEFEAALEAYRVAFRTQAVNLALDILARYDHMLYEEKKKLQQPGAAAALTQGIAGTQASGLYKKAKEKESLATMTQMGHDPEDKRGRGRDALQAKQYRDEAASARTQAEAEVIRGSGNDPLVAERGTDREKLAGLDAAGAQAYLLETINKRAEDVRTARQEFKDDPDRVFKLPDLISASQQLQGIDPETIYGWVIRDFIKAEQAKHLLSAIAIGILAIALAFLVPGGGWLAAAAIVANAGISTYQAYAAYKEYEEQAKDYRLHFISEEPSLFWVGVAIAAAALDLGIATSVVWKESSAALQALKGPMLEFSKDGELTKLVAKIEAADGLKAEVKTALAREAKAASASKAAWKEAFSHASLGMQGGSPGGLLQYFRGLYYSVKRGINTIAKLRADAKFLEIVGDLTRMSGAERAELETAFEEVKQLVKAGQAKAMDDASLLGYIDRWAINRGKPGFQAKLFEEMKAWKPLTAQQKKTLEAVVEQKSVVADLYREKESLLKERETLLPLQKDPTTRTEEARKRLLEINQRLGELDPSFKQQTVKQMVKTTNAQGEVVERLVDVPVKHRPGEIEQAEGFLAKAEKEAEQAQLTLYDRLRAAAPSDAAKDRALKGVTTDQIGSLKTKTKPTPLQADHIVSVREVADMDGFADLPWKDQKAIVDMKENLIAMDGAANASKSDRTWSSWKQASNYYDQAAIDAMVKREADVRAAIQAAIKDRLSKLPAAKP